MTSRVHVVLSCLLLGLSLLGPPAAAPPAAAAPVVGEGPEPPPPGSLRLRHLHSSSAWTTAPPVVAADVGGWQRSVDLLTMTESGGGVRQAALRAPGWSTAWFEGRGPRPGRRADASVRWRDAVWVERARASLPLSERTYPVKEGAARGITPNATAAVLERRDTGVVLLVTVAHLPSLVERADGTGLDRAPELASRLAAYGDALAGYREQVDTMTRRHDPDVRLVVADWNVDAKRPWARTLLREAWAGSGLVPAWPASYDGPGTFDDEREGHVRSRLIDGALVDAAATHLEAPRVLAPTSSSDHRPFVTTIGLPAAPGETAVTPLG
ncbi:hypothetical protein [Nocardioides sp. CFH 31398]|uniref:hypothetical protein n=1 Tax=Nocardioides sp. CFH 31398 TaxID=2919579 RepID=UPI001F062C6E|nr:hypothetical protein [Nocardioides sp. CFH 31398]MCH1867307.1 hypothetical protein [Nocardioides sp. CFH 31398]